MNRLILMLGFVILGLTSHAQKKEIDRTRELKIGSQLPSFPKSKVVNYPNKVYDYKKSANKLLILDFFNTSCASCIENMPRLNKLKMQFKDQLDVVMVTYEDKQRMEKFYANNKFLKKNNVNLPTIVSDTLLKRYFPHQAVSHTVWIMNNEVKAISHPDFVNEENIQRLLDGKTISIPLKNDFAISEIEEKSETIDSKGKSLIGSIQLTGYKNNLNSTGLKYRYDSLQQMHVTYINNLDILGAFTAAWAHIKTPKYFLTKDRVVWEVANPDRYFYDKSKSLPYHAWAEQYAICYERKDCLEVSDTVRVQKVLDDLSDLLNLDVKWETRKRPCLIIANEGKADEKKIAEIPDNDSNLVEGAETLTGYLDFAGVFPPVFDESKYTGIIKVPNGYDLEKLNARLSYYGLKIKESSRDMEVLVIRER